MARRTKAAADISKWKRKKWCAIIAPESFNKVFLGESLIYTDDEMVGKTILVNLMTLTNDIKKQAINVKFIVEAVKDGNAETKVIGYYMSPSAIKRMIRRNRDRIDLSFITKTKDGINLRMKPMLITRTKTKKSILTKVRAEVQKALAQKISQLSSEEVFLNVINKKIQGFLRERLAKIYPQKLIEIRCIQIEKKNVVAVKVEEEKPAPAPAE